MAFRALGWLLLALALAVIVHDLLTWWSQGAFPFSTVGSLWAHLDPASLGDARISAGRHMPGTLWNWTVRPLLMIPALLAFLVPGLVLLWIGNRDSGRQETDFLVGSRPRRRRSRGLS